MKLALATLALLLPFAAAAGPADDSAAVRGPRDHPGEWSSLGPAPRIAVNAALLPTGKVLYYGFSGDTVTLDPATGRFTVLDRSRTNLFCSGTAILADGRVLAIGGHYGFNVSNQQFQGLASAEEFDPETGEWTRVPDMSSPRWYPTGVTLQDGRVLVHNGVHEGVLNAKAEIYNPDTRSWSVAGERRLAPYARGHVMPDGLVHFTAHEAQASMFDPANGAWTAGATRLGGARWWSTSAQLDAETGETLVAGGHDAVTGRDAFRYRPADGAWSATARMAHPRTHADSVALPTGEVFVVGGDQFAWYSRPPNPAEMYDPRTGEWTTVLRPVWQHAYHATAVLLPDGSVVATNQQDRAVEVYKPWYFFAGARPRVTYAPTVAAYGAPIEVVTPDAADVREVVLVRHGASTHGLDTDQRVLRLEPVVLPRVSATALVPANRAVAPPGPYLLFLVNADGVPSLGRTITIGPGFGLLPAHVDE